MRKAQAAMEYLITYGWAVLIMLVVVGVLFYLGVFNPRGVAGCSFSTPGFTCFAYRLSSNVSNQSGLVLDLGQATGHDIKVVGFNCTAASDTYLVNDFAGASWQNVTIATGSHKILNGSASNPVPIMCLKKDGSNMSATDAGAYYKAKIFIHYIDLDSNLDHKAIGDISGTVE